ncbi:hypothetical protein L7F22_027350 [Adiantum nelumboides]|nr:hypothetical protein [Adiantum nelumboides]
MKSSCPITGEDPSYTAKDSLSNNPPYAQRIGSGVSVYLATVLEYLVAEVLELARNAARDNKKNRIIPCHIQLAIRNDEELRKLLSGVTIEHSSSDATQEVCRERRKEREGSKG